jgi:hypothetical protein
VDLVIDASAQVLFIVSSLFVGGFVVWSAESLGTIIKIQSMQAGKNIFGGAIVQMLSVLSRLGVFIQTFAIAWLIDTNMLMERRLHLVVGYLLVIFLTLLSMRRLFSYIGDFYGKYVSLATDKGLKVTFEWRSEGAKPSLIGIAGYVFLYAGAVFPLVGQKIDPDLSARSMAISAIFNGVSTVLLVGYLDVKYAIDLERSGQSRLPYSLYQSKFLAVFIVFFLAVLIWSIGI